MNDYIMAFGKEVNLFITKFCKNQQLRLNIPRYFRVEVEAYEDLAPGQTVYSWMYGGRKLRDTAITFKVRDMTNLKLYYPIFSVATGKALLKNWQLSLPPKFSVFAHKPKPRTVAPDKINQEMRNLLAYARLFVSIQKIYSCPMPYGFKEVFLQLYACPQESIDSSVVVLINNVISQYLANSHVIECRHLQEFIIYLQQRYQRLNFIDNDFSSLRQLLAAEDPQIKCYF